MTYRFLAEARWDLFDAAEWYDRCQPGLGDEFAEQVEAKVGDIVRTPRLYPKTQPVVRGREVRAA
jgi:hypothetical protein